MRIFLASQKCGWIKLALKLDENWKQLIYLKSGGDIGNLREKWVPNLKSSYTKRFWESTRLSQTYFFAGL